MMTLWAFFLGGGGGIAKLDYFWELFLNLRFRYRIGIFWGVANFKLFWGMSDTSDTFFGVGECLVQVYVARKIESTPQPGGIRRLHHFLLSFKADSHTTVHGFVFLL